MKFRILIAIFILLMLIFASTYGIANSCENMDIENAKQAAFHLMIGMYGYSKEEAQGLRYDSYIDEGSTATNVKVYPHQESNDPFILQFRYDGSLIEKNTSIPQSGYTIDPTEISIQEAIDAAHHLLIGLYGYTDGIVSSFAYKATDRIDLELIHVDVYPFEDLDEHFSLDYWYDGRLMSIIKPEILDFDEYYNTVRESGRPFQWFTHQERAAYSVKYIPKVEAALKLNPLDHNAQYHYAFTRHIYGLPDQLDVDEQKALDIAQETLVDRFMCKSDCVKRAGYEAYFDICDPQNKLWKLYFTYTEGGKNKKYIIRIDSHSGEVVDAYELTIGTSLDERY